jgi:hypothetical protein
MMWRTKCCPNSARCVLAGMKTRSVSRAWYDEFCVFRSHHADHQERQAAYVDLAAYRILTLVQQGIEPRAQHRHAPALVHVHLVDEAAAIACM